MKAAVVYLHGVNTHFRYRFVYRTCSKLGKLSQPSQPYLSLWHPQETALISRKSFYYVKSAATSLIFSVLTMCHISCTKMWTAAISPIFNIFSYVPPFLSLNVDCCLGHFSFWPYRTTVHFRVQILTYNLDIFPGRSVLETRTAVFSEMFVLH